MSYVEARLAEIHYWLHTYPEICRIRREREHAEAMRRQNTPGYNVHLEIAFTTDKYGRPIAFRWSPSGHRWIRMSLSDARSFVASEEATQVTYTGPRVEQVNPRASSRTSNDRSRKRSRR